MVIDHGISHKVIFFEGYSTTNVMAFDNMLCTFSSRVRTYAVRRCGLFIVHKCIIFQIYLRIFNAKSLYLKFW